MKKLHIRSLFKKLFVSFVLVALVTVFSLGIFLPSQLSNYLTENARSRLEEEARLIIPSISIFFSGRISFDAMQQILTTIEYFSSAQVFLTDCNGQILVTSAGYETNVRGQFIAEDELFDLLQNNQFSRQGYNPRLATYALTLAFPIRQLTAEQMSIVGTLYLETPLDVIGASSAIIQKQALIIVLISFVLALILAYIFSRHIAEPLYALTVAAQSMARGNYAITIPYDEDDEIGDLIESFNNLSRSLQKSIDSLLTEKGRMENLLRSLTEGVIATENNETVVLFNPAAQQLLAIPLDENPNGKKLSALHLPAELYQMMSEDSTSIVTKILSFSNERFVAVTVSPVLDRLGRFTGHVTVLQDITEAHTLELQRKAFVANVSHELRTPLTSIRGFVEGILDETIPLESSPRYLNIIHKETIRLTKLIQDLLELSFIESGQIKLHRECVPLLPILSRLAMQCKSATGKESQLFTVRFDMAEPAVWADPDRLEQILMNLMSNASKFTPPNGTIQIIGVSVGQKMEITIQDSGPGIAAEDLPYIWDRFYKADHSRSKEGTGLGLSIVRSLIEAHGEKISVNNDPLGGCCFTFTMPVCFDSGEDELGSDEISTE
ncbi:MAG: cell wall metabolism sensor histidine kinase WalK [Negativicutes bacterium]|nr:cell wall metabolism sensor histidine kinase WalK [Negativicutes bacterium]